MISSDFLHSGTYLKALPLFLTASLIILSVIFSLGTYFYDKPSFSTANSIISSVILSSGTNSNVIT
jgi:hypothetical protein